MLFWDLKAFCQFSIKAEQIITTLKGFEPKLYAKPSSITLGLSSKGEQNINPYYG